MGSLYKVWADLPEDIEELNYLMKNFRDYFGWDWSEVMAGAEEPFDYHKDWDGYIAIKDLKKCSGLMVADLHAENVYKIILG
ncbi:hypothetical protein [Desulfolucanica intricata]|uniref:hypothetical protein n=1 Tax=Desulfolucanica intricata TaxID=1285191 RepID=UPI00083158C6|nr:hypothetical protein [Desulfolucanica intricata]